MINPNCPTPPCNEWFTGTQIRGRKHNTPNDAFSPWRSRRDEPPQVGNDRQRLERKKKRHAFDPHRFCPTKRVVGSALTYDWLRILGMDHRNSKIGHGRRRFIGGGVQVVRFDRDGVLVVLAGADLVLMPPEAPSNLNVEMHSHDAVFLFQDGMRGRLVSRGTAICTRSNLVGTVCGGVQRYPRFCHEDALARTAEEWDEEYRLDLGEPWRVSDTAVVGIVPGALVTDGGELLLIDANQSVCTIYGRDAAGFTALSASNPPLELVTASGSGSVSIWDARSPRTSLVDRTTMRSTGTIARHCSELTLPTPPGATILTLDMDENRIVGGSNLGEMIEWDRRRPEAAVSAVRMHHGPVLDVRCIRGGMYPFRYASCGTDGRVYIGGAPGEQERVKRGGPGTDYSRSIDVDDAGEVAAYGGDAGFLYSTMISS